MHRTLLIATLAFLAIGAAPKPRVAICGLAIESSTFSPATTDEAAFHASAGQAILDTYPFFSGPHSLRDRAVWVGALQGHALPGGAVTRDAYESLMQKMLDGLRAALPLDGLFFDIHGAMSVVGMEDAEGDMISRVRAVVGPRTLISTSMDLHGNVSWRLAAESDLITCYRMAPHEDEIESKQRAVENLLTRLESGKGRPAYKAYIAVPVLLPGEQTSTRIEPARSIYAAIPAITKRPGIIDAAIWIGYAWADEPRNHAAVMVTGDDQAAVKAAAESLAASFWAARRQFDFVAPTLPWDQALERALTILRERRAASEVEPVTLALLARAHLAAGEIARAAAVAAEALTVARENGSHWSEVQALEARSYALLAGDVAEHAAGMGA